MKNKEKPLLLQDLCARLSYGVKIATRIVGNTSFSDSCLSGELLDDFIKKEWGEIKPYLRPMSSMTEEERLEYLDFLKVEIQDGGYVTENYVVSLTDMPMLINWLNAHHFDYRGLIPMGLALEAKEGMYKEGGEE